MASPLLKAMSSKSYKGLAPKNVPGLSMGDGGKKGTTPPKIMKGARSAGAMWKTPTIGALRGKNATDKSSGQSNPVKQSASDKNRYRQAHQPAAFSNLDNGGQKGTKFVC